MRLKIHKKLRTASLNSEFSSSYKKNTMYSTPLLQATRYYPIFGIGFTVTRIRVSYAALIVVFILLIAK